MHRIKIMLVSLLAMFAVAAVAAAAATAKDCEGGSGLCLFQVSGKSKFGKAAISNKAIFITGGELEGDGLRIICLSLKIEGGEVEEGSPAKGSATSAVLSGCKETAEEAECELSSENISTNPIKILAISGSELELKETGGFFALVKLNSKAGSTCLSKGKYKITGAAKIKISEPTVEKKNHAITLSGSGLEIDGNPATLEGSGLLLFLLSGVELNWCLLTT
jgi:hypothetical protein